MASQLSRSEAAAEVMRGYAEEIHRLNREWRSSGETDRRELACVEKKIKGSSRRS